MNAEEATVVATAEDAIAAAEAEEAIEDKDKSSHRLIGGNNKDEGSGSVSSGSSDEIPTRFRRRLRRGSGGCSGEVVVAPTRQWAVAGTFQ